MKLTIPTTDLLNSLKKAKGCVERRNTIPILSNVLLTAGKDSLSLRATDLDLEISLSVPAKVAKEGATTVAAEMLFQFVSKLPKTGDVVIEQVADKAQVVVRSGRSRVTLNTLEAVDFPDLAVGDLSHNFEISGAELNRLLGQTSFCASTEQTRYYLNGIHLHHLGENLRAVATDGHRLALVDVATPAGAAAMPGIIVPSKAIAEALKLIGDVDTVSIGLSTNKIRMDFGGTVLVSKLIDQTYPDYARVVPAANDKTMVVDRADLLGAVDRVSTVASERGRAVKLSMTKGALALSVINADAGNAAEEMEVEYDSAPVDVGFNSQYLMDIIEQVTGDLISLSFADPGSPTLIHANDSKTATYVLMPMRVG